MKNLTQIKKLLAYIVVPVIFAITGYGVLRVALTPVWYLASTAAYFLIADNAVSFEEEINDTYNPEDEIPVHEEEFIDSKDISMPKAGEKYGNLECERIKLNAPVYWGDSNKILRSGAGTDIASFPPGFGRVITICAHNTTFFKPMKNIQEGDIISFNTNYEKYTYKITDVEVINENKLQEKFNKMILDENEVLMLYTCYPFHAISGRKTNRLVAFGERIEGLSVKCREE